MSAILTSYVTAAGGILAGLALAGALLWRQQQALHRARYAASHDPLTGLPNRRALTEHLRAVLGRGSPLGVVLLDLDRFKAVNDSLGHDAGDQLLRAVAGRLADLPGPVRLAARLAGDEFVLVVHADADPTLAAAHAAWQAISASPIPVGRHLVEVSASVGVAMARLGISHRQLLHHADLAMYQAKNNGGGVHAHSPGTGETPLTARPAQRPRDRHP